MKVWSFITVGLSVLAAFVTAEGDTLVVELDETNFEEKTKEGNWIIEFYGPTCGFCKMLEPTWEKLAKEAQEDDLPLNVGKVNIRECRELSRKFQIGKLPGIKLIREDEDETFTLPNARQTRTVDEYLEYALEYYAEIEAEERERVAEELRKEAEMDAASKVVWLNGDNFEELTQEGDWLIEFYGPKCGYCKQLRPKWDALGALVNEDDTMGFKVAKIDAAENFTYTRQFKANPWPAIKLLKDGKAYTFPDPRNMGIELEEYVSFSQGGWESIPEDEVIIPEYIEEAKKRAERRNKYAKMKAARKAKKDDAKHDDS
jgi:thioredoxin-like negative regulator of GroEL